MSLTLTEYLPDPSNLNAGDVIATRKRLQAYLQQNWPDLDTRPNSVFGDIYLTPMALMTTALEQAMARFRSDLDLANVAAGVIFDADFVTAYLKNFGVSSAVAINSTGTVKLVFDTDQEYILDSGVSFVFGSTIFFVNPEEGNPVYIKPTSQPNSPRPLTKIGEDQFAVYLPVTGTPGAAIGDGAQATLSTPIPGLLTVTAMGDFDSGSPVEDLVSLAAKAQKQFSAANLASRSGILSFASTRWPGMKALSATVTGDREMLRSGVNPLGIYEGAVDLFVRSSARYAEGETLVRLTYDLDRQAWIGQLTLPVVPAFYALAAGIFQTNFFQSNRGVNHVYSRSLHPTVDGPAIAYSRYEMLGIAIQDTNPVDFTPAVTGQITARTPTNSRMDVRGEYNGSLFSRHGDRSVRIRFDALTEVDGEPVLAANVRDAVSGEVAQVFFMENDSVNPTKGLIVQTTPGYAVMFSGLEIDLVPSGNSLVLSDWVGLEFEFAYSGRTASFSVNYQYDPFLVQVDSVLKNPDHKPVNVDPVARNFIMCHIEQFTINYRLRYGQRLDVSSATDDIVTYLNGLGWPNQYEDAMIGAILAKYGASGLQSVVKKGIFYPSLASVFVNRDGVEVPIPRVLTSTLLPPLNDQGFGLRNIGYLVERDTLTFNGSAY